MSNYKTSKKGELVAIYRLEFYKNQKKWKFGKNDKKLKNQVPSKQKLNETYQVEEEEPEVEPPAPLNDAFLETDSDENLKEAPPGAPRRRWSTILDLKVEPDLDTIENEEWTLEEKPGVCGGGGGGRPPLERLRSYEEEAERGGGGGGGAALWGRPDQVYSSELYIPNERSRLPTFPGWPATAQHTPTDPNILRNILQSAGQKTGRKNVAETLRQHIQNFTQNIPQTGPNLTCMNQSVGRNLYDCNVEPNLRRNVTQDADHMYYAQNLKQDQNFGQNIKQFVENVGQVGQNFGDLGPNMASGGQFGQTVAGFGQNGGLIGQNVSSFGQNGGLIGQNMASFGQNCIYVEKDIDIFGPDIVQDIEQCDEVLACELAEWDGRGEGGEWGEGEVGGDAERWLRGSLAQFYLEPCVGEAAYAPQCGDVSLSSGDSAAFIRGAHERPHSSEVDLVKETTCPCLLSSRSLSLMSTAALTLALQSHTAFVRRLLRELRARAPDQQPCPGAMSGDVTRSSLPTRDGADPPATGRGRGRRLLTK